MTLTNQCDLAIVVKLQFATLIIVDKLIYFKRRLIMTDDNKDVVVNAEDYGFTADDLQDVETQVTDDVETTESIDSESSTDIPLNSDVDESTVTDEVSETSNESSELTQDNHGDLNKALVAERNRRKEAERKLNEFKQQSTQVTLSEQEVSNINDFASKTAMQQLGIDNVEDIMYAEPDKYAQLMELQGQIKYVITQEQQQRVAMRNQNMAFINQLTSADDFKDVFAMAQDELNSMTRAESNPIDAAYARIDNGLGTQQDFDIINNFVERLRNKRNEQAVQQAPQSNPLDKTKDLPKAGALGGGNGKVAATISDDELIKIVAEGRESELPESLQRQIKELIG